MSTIKRANLLWVLQFALIVLVFIAFGAVLLTEIVPDAKRLSYVSRLGSEGTVSDAVVLDKGVRDTLTFPTDGLLRSALWVKVEFPGADGTPVQRHFGVSPRSYHNYDLGDSLQVAYLIEAPGRYQIWGSIKDNEKQRSEIRGDLVTSAAVLAFLTLASTFLGVIMCYMHPRRARPEVSFDGRPAKCPVCGSRVEEGSISQTASWYPVEGSRRRFEFFRGLPGEHWYERQYMRKLPGYHCANCSTILFKYK